VNMVPMTPSVRRMPRDPLSYTTYGMKAPLSFR
jgi:hypothetical protein